MNLSDFDQHRAEFNQYCSQILTSKGKDYAGEGDRHSNFKDVAKRLGLTPVQVWGVYMLKHVISMETFIRTGSLSSESVRSRFADMRNYLDLGLSLIDESNATNKFGTTSYRTVPEERVNVPDATAYFGEEDSLFTSRYEFVKKFEQRLNHLKDLFNVHPRD